VKEWFGSPEAKAALAGLLGALVRVLTLRERLWPDAVISLVVGAISSVYFGPALQPGLVRLFQMDHADAASLAGFIVGVAGILLIGGVMDFLRARLARETEKRS